MTIETNVKLSFFVNLVIASTKGQIQMTAFVSATYLS